MYQQYFGLNEAPFSIAVNPRYLFMSARHRDALAHLLYGVGSGGGFILLTGEVGTGKTTLNRCLLEQMPESSDIAIILNPALNALELLATVCDELGIAYDGDTPTLKTLTDKLQRFLLDNHQRGRNTVLLIDEAQHLQFDVLEQIRLLTNLETNTRKLLQIILVGQPELAAMLARPELRQLNQRITARYNLRPLSRDETHAYIRHRLQVAGLPPGQELFSRNIVHRIHRYTQGIPRLINVLCERVLLGTYGKNKTRVDRAVLKQAAQEVFGEAVSAGPRRRWWLPLGIGLVVTAALLVVAGLLSTPTVVVPPLPVATVVVPEPALAWYGTEAAALSVLGAVHGVPTPAGKNLCGELSTLGLRCESGRAQSWDELLSFNRPALLQLVTPQRFTVYTTLLAVDGELALVSYSGQRHSVSLGELGVLWSGNYTFIWSPPRAFVEQVSMGQKSELVSWLAAQFAALDGQARPLAEGRFNAALDSRVRIFQNLKGLDDDGVVGLKTLLKLNEVLGRAVTLEG